jgi:hypothetical protein
MPNQATPSCAESGAGGDRGLAVIRVIDLRDRFLLESSP